MRSVCCGLNAVNASHPAVLLRFFLPVFKCMAGRIAAQYACNPPGHKDGSGLAWTSSRRERRRPQAGSFLYNQRTARQSAALLVVASRSSPPRQATRKNPRRTLPKRPETKSSRAGYCCSIPPPGQGDVALAGRKPQTDHSQERQFHCTAFPNGCMRSVCCGLNAVNASRPAVLLLLLQCPHCKNPCGSFIVCGASPAKHVATVNRKTNTSYELLAECHVARQKKREPFSRFF